MQLSKLKEKRVYLPFVIFAVCIALFVVLKSMKKPPEEKTAESVAPLVKVEPISFQPLQLSVTSQGLVKPKFNTQLVAQVGGAVAFIAPEFVRGGFVKKGQVLAQIEDADYQALVLEARAALISARASLQQEEALGAVARDEWSRIKNRKPTALSLREPQLAQEQARVKAAEAALARAEKNLERTRIRAPFHALVEARDIGLGTYLNPGAPVGQVLSVSEAEIRLPVADNQLQFLENQGVGTEVLLKGQLEGEASEWVAKVIRTEGVIDDKSRMAYLVAQVLNPYGLAVPSEDDSALDQETHHPLRFGSYVRAEIQGISLPKAALIPRHLVTDGKVPVLSKDNTLQFKPVTTVRDQGVKVVVVDGVEDQDQLIVSALQYPVEGMALRLPATKTAAGGSGDAEAGGAVAELANTSD
ncbi:efflux RND transporter periplasmic adaptor subunit [Simiduia sp. 21SJ11W-1]|uniref:efflux RND transporter periplasmic adaptor subunit n=1 Tax=Simiduia sp. 21SJ11W-1 TaxID=2909669 RepID=UPI0020A02330|nr:efflux RND transporter periplasmic adaptor subunit [Simiduia sp. 21SJ11W-1]UTA46818.1 efflux RND transporter periplasmic adaptor subunit [Simiduia sp. 21SJ11W-1]